MGNTWADAYKTLFATEREERENRMKICRSVLSNQAIEVYELALRTKQSQRIQLNKEIEEIERTLGIR